MPDEQFDPELEQLHLALHKLGNRLLEGIQAEMEMQPWAHSVLDVRGSAIDDETFLTMLKVRLPESWTAIAVHTSEEVDDLVSAIWNRRNRFANKWYGLKVRVTPEGECDIKFDYNSQAIGDPSFLDMTACE